MVGRFEDYLRDVTEHALGHFGRATPPLTRNQLEVELQVTIVRANLIAASRENIHGNRIDARTRIAKLEAVARKVAADDIWGQDAVDTASNPGPETVKALLSLLGVPKPWPSIEAHFQRLWLFELSKSPHLKVVPKAKDELESVLLWRNTVAHSRSVLQIGAGELVNASRFLRVLSDAIDRVLQTRMNNIIRAANAVPANWR